MLIYTEYYIIKLKTQIRCLQQLALPHPNLRGQICTKRNEKKNVNITSNRLNITDSKEVKTNKHMIGHELRILPHTRKKNTVNLQRKIT